ncbi:hypothetical protein [Pelistega suis]|uniref:hypothetical protein n=1 Tax=Pelistega suis TaxID=1631957 RepID=UPI00211CEA79|nr:hypothetical protein [Pelistega suis]MCQ9328510.1 hypothetical protein [Pelistega suis]
MTLYHFTILIRDANPSMEQLEDRLFEAGCDDALICFNNQTVYLEFDREATVAKEAVKSAMENIQSAGFYDLVLQESGVSSLAEIAHRTGLTRAAVSNYALGKRAMGFPKPLYGVASGSPLYSWREVANWLYANKKLSKAQFEIANIGW